MRQGAYYALTKGEGDGTEYMDLFAALCRSLEIPARCVGGYICKESQLLKPSEYHNWSDMYLSGIWEPVDPMNGKYRENRADYVAMRIFGRSEGETAQTVESFDRLRFTGDGLEVKMQ